MVDEKEQPREEAIPPTKAEEQPLEEAVEPEVRLEAKEQAAATHVREEKKGRLMAAAFVATVIVSFLALAVAGIVQLTSRWLITCPTDLPVNDPAPVLWKAAVSGDVTVQSLGVPEKILEQARFKQK
jgi:hypothetical protein